MFTIYLSQYPVLSFMGKKVASLFRINYNHIDTWHNWTMAETKSRLGKYDWTFAYINFYFYYYPIEVVMFLLHS